MTSLRAMAAVRGSGLAGFWSAQAHVFRHVYTHVDGYVSRLTGSGSGAGTFVEAISLDVCTNMCVDLSIYAALECSDAHIYARKHARVRIGAGFAQMPTTA